MKYGNKGMDLEEEEPFFLDRFVISSNSSFTQIWKFFLIILSMMSSFHYAYMAAFLLNLDDEGTTQFFNFDLFYNIVFAVDLVLNFLFELYDQKSEYYERRFLVISEQYLRGRFLTDFVTVLPLYHLFKFFKHGRLFFLIKLTRLMRGIELLDTAVIMGSLKDVVKGHITSIIKSGDEDKANDKINNHNFISHIVVAGYVVKMLKLIIIMCCISYLFGICWYILGTIELDYP